MAKKFEPIQRYKTDKEGNTVEVNLYKGTTFEDMVVWLKENGTKEEIAEFKKECSQKHKCVDVIDKETGQVKRTKSGKKVREQTTEIIPCKEGEVNILGAKIWFFNKFAPEHAPKKKEKPNRPSVKDLLADL